MKVHENILVFSKETGGTYNPIMEPGEPYSRKSSNPEGYVGRKNDHGYGLKPRTEFSNPGVRYPKSIRNVSRDFSAQQQVHPTQKPVPLLEWLVETYSNPGETVLDNCMGSGSTGVLVETQADSSSESNWILTIFKSQPPELIMANGPKKDDIVMTETVTLDGFQAVMQPGKYGYSLTAIIESDLVDQLEEKRAQLLEWGLSKVKNPKRSVCKPEPWEEVAQGKFKIKMSWGEDAKPGIVDSVGTDITNPNLPLYGGSKVRLALWQKPYVLKDGVSYGTSLKCVGAPKLLTLVLKPVLAKILTLM